MELLAERERTMADKSPKVVDFSTHFSGPIASRQLVQLGADVVKIEHPVHGDGNREVPPVVDGESAMHPYINASTRSLAVAPRSPAWGPVVEAACKWADVVIVGTRPSSARKRGIDYASVVRHNPEIVYCLISGYGIDGPWADYLAHGLQMDVLAGALPLDHDDEGRPLPPPWYRSVGTTLAGIEAALGIYAALDRRHRGLGSQFVHVSIWESALAWQWRDTTSFERYGQPWTGYRDQGSRYWMYPTADDKAILVCPIERHFWERFCDVVGLPTEAKSLGTWDTTGIDFGVGYEDERLQIEKHLRQRDRDEWVRILAAAEVPVAPVLSVGEAMRSPHAEANGVLVSFPYRGRTTTIPTTPVSVTSRPGDEPTDAALAGAHRAKGDLLGPPPRIGEHREEILEMLGLPGLDLSTRE